MGLQITYDKKTHAQGLTVYRNQKLKTGIPLIIGIVLKEGEK